MVNKMDEDNSEEYKGVKITWSNEERGYSKSYVVKLTKNGERLAEFWCPKKYEISKGQFRKYLRDKIDFAQKHGVEIERPNHADELIGNRNIEGTGTGVFYFKGFRVLYGKSEGTEMYHAWVWTNMASEGKGYEIIRAKDSSPDRLAEKMKKLIFAYLKFVETCKDDESILEYFLEK